MKRLIPVLLCFLLLFSCKKEEVTTYQVFNNLEGLSDFWIKYLSENDPEIVPYLDGTLYEVIVYCYTGSDIVRTDNIGTISRKGGKSGILEVESNYEKVKVSFLFFPPELPVKLAPALWRFHLVTTTILEKGKNNIITVGSGILITNSAIK
ncbi:MAG: hypothetical protein IPJ16_13105 [Bacteroidales bacterium]|nr:hypothetical protein [Bacteroidales bacterium]